MPHDMALMEEKEVFILNFYFKSCSRVKKTNDRKSLKISFFRMFSDEIVFLKNNRFNYSNGN